MDFYILEAPYDSTSDPDRNLQARGFKPPFKDWMPVIESAKDDKGEEYQVATAEESLKLLYKTIEEHGPFDGVLGFS